MDEVKGKDILQHYGVKGMKWDEAKKKAKSKLSDVKKEASQNINSAKKTAVGATKTATKKAKSATKTAKQKASKIAKAFEAKPVRQGPMSPLEREWTAEFKRREQKAKNDKVRKKNAPTKSRTVNLVKDTVSAVKQEKTNRRIKKSPAVANPPKKKSYASIIKKNAANLKKEASYDVNKVLGTGNNNTIIKTKQTGAKGVISSVKKDLKTLKESLSGKPPAPKKKKPLDKYNKVNRATLPTRKTTKKTTTTVYVESPKRR